MANPENRFISGKETVAMTAKDLLGFVEKDGKLETTSYVDREVDLQLVTPSKSFTFDRGAQLSIAQPDKDGKPSDKILFVFDASKDTRQAKDDFADVEKTLVGELQKAIKSGKKQDIIAFGFNDDEAEKLIAGTLQVIPPQGIMGVNGGQNPAPGAPGAPDIIPAGVGDPNKEERDKYIQAQLQKSGVAPAANAENEDQALSQEALNKTLITNSMANNYNADAITRMRLTNEAIADVARALDTDGNRKISSDEVATLKEGHKDFNQENLAFIKQRMNLNGDDELTKDEFKKFADALKFENPQDVKSLSDIVMPPATPNTPKDKEREGP
jgi:hypothetical protein